MDVAMIEVFKKCGPDGGRALAEMLKNLDHEAIVHANRQMMLKAIGEMRNENEVKATVPILVELLQSKKSYFDYRTDVLETLGEIGVPASAAISAVEMLKNDPHVGKAARVALRRMGKVANK